MRWMWMTISVLMLASHPAWSGILTCSPRSSIIKFLTVHYGEHLMMTLVSGNSYKLEVFAAAGGS